MHPTRAVIGLIRLGDSEFVLGDPEDELSELRAEGVSRKLPWPRSYASEPQPNDRVGGFGG